LISARAEISDDVSSGSACSTTSPASSRTPTAWARWKPRGWPRKISTAAARNIKVEIVYADHQNKADVGSAIARKWLDVDGVDAIVDVPNSAVGLTINSLLRDTSMTFLASSTASSDLTGKACSPNTIQWVNDAWATGNTTAAAMMARGGKDWYFSR
jgi:branched-chain amino acid transport system substrate-binding protein